MGGAPFRPYGVQRLLRITVGRNGQRKDLYATDEHRWFAKTGGGGRHREILTKDLRPGHRLAPIFPRSRVTAHHTFPVRDRPRLHVR